MINILTENQKPTIYKVKNSYISRKYPKFISTLDQNLENMPKN